MTIGKTTRLTPDLYTCEVNEDGACVGSTYGATAEEAAARAAQFAATTLLDELAEWFTEFRDDLVADNYAVTVIDKFLERLSPFAHEEV